MKRKIVGFLKRFKYRVNIGYIFGEYENTWGNQNGWGISLSFGLGILRPDD